MALADGNQATSARSEAALEALRTEITRLPIPAAPPRYPSWGTSVGVNFLDAALNQNHVVRRSERLTVPDRTHLSRTISVRVSLDRLTPTQAAAGLRYGKLSEGTSHRILASQLDELDGRSPLVWVPITRLVRESAAPVRIYDNEGRELPRATQPELLPFVNAALYSLLRVVLRADLDAQRPGTRLFKFLFGTNRARWLLEQAIASLVYAQHPGAWRTDASGHVAVPLDDPVRRLACDVLDEYVQQETALLELLHHAATEHLLVVGLLASKREHHLTYEAPPLAAVGRSSQSGRLGELCRALLPTGRRFLLRYNTHLPPSLDSAHFSLELDPRIRVRDALLVRDSDEPQRQLLSDNLRELDGLRSTSSTNAHIEHETDATLAGIAELASRREADWLSYRERWDAIRDVEGTKRLDWRMPNERLLGVVHQLDDLRAPQSNAADSGTNGHDGRIRHLAKEVDELQLGQDVTVNDDPRRNAAHMYRRQSIPSSVPPQPRTSAASLHATLTDEPSSLLGSVPSWLGALLTLVLALGIAFFRSLRFLAPWSHAALQVNDDNIIQTDAVVAILLIVPGLLLTRIDLPGPMTLAGRLRVLDRTAAFVAIASTGALAVVIATEPTSDWAMRAAFFWVSLTLFLLLVVTGTDIALSRIRARRPSVRSLQAPLWLTPHGEKRKIRYDVVFDTRGARDVLARLQATTERHR